MLQKAEKRLENILYGLCNNTPFNLEFCAVTLWALLQSHQLAVTSINVYNGSELRLYDQRPAEKQVGATEDIVGTLASEARRA